MRGLPRHSRADCRMGQARDFPYNCDLISKETRFRIGSMNMMDIKDRERLTRLAKALINQQQAEVIIPAQRPESGFWFGGGNMVADSDGTRFIVGRYRNAGDSRTGVSAGERGLELAVFRDSESRGSFEKELSFTKQELSFDEMSVLSIEGSALSIGPSSVELFVSSEKTNVPYPDELEGYLKPGTGVWTIDRLEAPSLAALKQAKHTTIVQSADPRFMHVKDPLLYSIDEQHQLLFFCSHPFCWTSSNTGYVECDRAGGFKGEIEFDAFPRGYTWDVAISRATSVLDLPSVGAFKNRTASLLFYDGGECVRNHEEHQHAVSRPRGYSCEELGGVAFFCNGDYNRIERLSVTQPFFVSPHGTGCSRYVDVLATPDALIATWQQAQEDGSQPLVMHQLSMADVEAILE